MPQHNKFIAIFAFFILPWVSLWADDAEITELKRRIEKLEKNQKDIEQGLNSEEESQYEPELTYRLKATEQQVLDTRKSVAIVEALEGISASLSFTTVAQKPYGLPADSNNGSELNYRGDVNVALPLSSFGRLQSELFAHFRMGQGKGLNQLDTLAPPNAAAFRVLNSDPDNSIPVLGEAMVKFTLPVGNVLSPENHLLKLDFGKMDPFTYFDQNAVANDESHQFLNAVFVHNTLLDAGGEIGVDANGFAPGFHLAYINQVNKSEPWGVSLGYTGTNRGANYEKFFSSPLLMAQIEKQWHPFIGLTGHYRAYYWKNGQASRESAPNETQRRSGWGLSIDQKISNTLILFGRVGRHIAGNDPRIDAGYSLGFEWIGDAWHRGGDALGMAHGWQKANQQTEEKMGVEHVTELYYRYALFSGFTISPDFQWFRHAKGDKSNSDVKIIGLRVQVDY